MKFTISDCISRINQALNYPAISYEDVSHFFDQAIAELNTSLRIALPTVSEMRDEHIFKVSDSPYAVVLSSTLSNFSITTINSGPSSDSDYGDAQVLYYADTTYPINSSFYVLKNGVWTKSSVAYGVVAGADVAYEAIPVAHSYGIWHEIPLNDVKEFSLTEYLPTDWIILFIIPYVCFKFAVRNGDSGELFSDEFTQGFQQLQTSYNVPNTVELTTVAHLPAYKEQVGANLANLSVSVPTRAITNGMLVRNGIRPVNGANVFDTGGWGI